MSRGRYGTEASADGRARERPGLYGPRGWTVRTGVWRLLSPWTSGLDPVTPVAPVSPARSAGPVSSTGEPGADYVPFRGLDHLTARRLLAVLPGPALEDRQNRAPNLGALLRACAGGEGSVRLCGYAIGPQREDERVSVEALWVAAADLGDPLGPVGPPGPGAGLAGGPLDGLATGPWEGVCGGAASLPGPGAGTQVPEPRPGPDGHVTRPSCREEPWCGTGPGAPDGCDTPDAPGPPDEIRLMRPPWAQGALGWWLWWD